MILNVFGGLMIEVLPSLMKIGFISQINV